MAVSTSITSKVRRRPGDEEKKKASKRAATSPSPFLLRNADGEESGMEEYLSTVATLSPWVPSPDVVIRRVLSMAQVGSDDVHCDLGSGDGRVNFHALDICNVRKTMGVEVDATLVQQSWDRVDKRHPRPSNVHFVCADLKTESESFWKSLAKECTIVTMYFVPEALEELRPLFETHFLGKKCRIVTIGYEMEAWEPSLVDIVLGLTIHIYDMNQERLMRIAEDAAPGANAGMEQEDEYLYRRYGESAEAFYQSLEDGESLRQDYKEEDDMFQDYFHEKRTPGEK